MKTLLESICSTIEAPQFMSCSSFECEDEFILYSGPVKLLFAIVEDIDSMDEAPRFFRQIDHENGDTDFVVLADCFNPSWFEGKNEEEGAEFIENVMDELEGWFISEVLDLDSYDEE